MLNTSEKVNNTSSSSSTTGQSINTKTGDANIFNSNVFIKDAPQEKSFSEQLNELQKAAVDQQLNQAKLNTSETANKALLNDQAQKVVSALGKEGINLTPEEAIQLIEQRKLDLKKEQQGLLSHEAAKSKDAHEIAHKTAANESAIATAMQANQDEAKDAVKEGNQGEQQAQDNSGNDRKSQLANWDILTPRVIEDIKNKAIRIDIPGLKDISTIIVRMKGSQLSIQAAGSESAMNLLQGGQGELNTRLSQHNVQLAELKTVDASKVRRKSA